MAQCNKKKCDNYLLFVKQFLYNLSHGADFPNFTDSGATEDQSFIQIAFHCIDQRFCNTVMGFGRIACLQALKTVGDFFIFSFNGSDKCIADGPSRHSHRAVNDHNIFFFCVHISLFVGITGIAFFGGNKTACRLYPICPQFQTGTCCTSSAVKMPPATKTGMAAPYFSS